MAVTIEPTMDPGLSHDRVLVTWGPGHDDVSRLLSTLGLADAGVDVEVLCCSGAECRIRLSAPDPERLTWALGVVRAGLGDAVLGDDGATLEGAVVELLRRQGLWLGVTEGLTNGLLSARLAGPPGAHEVVRLGADAIPDGPAATGRAAMELAEDVARRLDVPVALAVVGPAHAVHVGSWLDGEARAVELSLTGDAQRIRHDAASHALDHVRHRLLARERVRARRH